MDARFNTATKGKITCNLCPHNCKIVPGSKGRCRTRVNNNGTLKAGLYGIVSAIHLDPVEKKPLYHWNPGREILSLGSYGCNLDCFFCQNHHISKPAKDSTIMAGNKYSPAEIAAMAGGTGGSKPGLIAFTYNEPVVWYEFMYDIASEAASMGVATAMVTNGFINSDPLEEILPLINAFNIDLKSFDDEFYSRHAGGKLQPVLNTIKRVSRSESHMEITFLAIPGLNDNMEMFNKMLNWILDECGETTVLHISRYFPPYMSDTGPTPEDTIKRMAERARNKLKFVYTGNMGSDKGNDTRCPGCDNIVIERKGYYTRIPGADNSGNCLSCGEKIFRITSSV